MAWFCAPFYNTFLKMQQEGGTNTVSSLLSPKSGVSYLKLILFGRRVRHVRQSGLQHSLVGHCVRVHAVPAHRIPPAVSQSGGSEDPHPADPPHLYPAPNRRAVTAADPSSHRRRPGPVPCPRRLYLPSGRCRAAGLHRPGHHAAPAGPAPGQDRRSRDGPKKACLVRQAERR